MSDAFTLGPWAMNECVSDEGGGCICFEIWSDDADPIALVEMPMAHYAAWSGGEVLSEHNEATRANAHLIAAAPELYDALEALLFRCELYFGKWRSGYTDDAIMLRAGNALAKARGEQVLFTDHTTKDRLAALSAIPIPATGEVERDRSGETVCGFRVAARKVFP